MELKNKKLALFFTTGVSLKTWEKVGNLAREIKPYKELAKYFKEIYFFTYGDKRDLEYQKLLPENIRIFPKKWNLPSILYSLFLPFLFSKELKKADILKTNQMSGSWSAVLTKWLYRKKLVVRCGYEWLKTKEKEKEAWWKLWLASFLEELSYKNADKIIVTSLEDRKFVEKRFRIKSLKIEIIPNYIDVELFKPLNISKEKGRIIFVGRLEKGKNLFNLIEAIANLPVKLVLIGSGSLKEKLKKFSKEKKANVEFKGNIANEKLPEELNKSEIFVLPSFYEGCPKVLLEAMSCGLPCVGADVEGIKEIIRHKENGYLCKTDAKSIKEAIVNILQNKELQEKMGENARKTILENFSLEKILEKELKIYEIL